MYSSLIRPRIFLSKYVAAIALLILILFNVFFTSHFASWVSFTNLFTQATKVALVGLGMTLIIASGGIDISVGSAMGLGAVIAAIAIHNENIWGVLISILVIVALSVLSGYLDSKLMILPLVSTLAIMYIMRGLARGISGRGTVTYSNPDLTKFFITPIGGVIPMHFFLLLVVGVIMYIVVNKMKFGFELEAYGNNRIAARISGIDTTKTIMICYIIGGIMCWLGGILVMGMVSSTDPARVGLDMEVDAIAATVIGGTPITGGYPNILGTICGAFLLQLITMMVNMNNVPYAYSLMVKASIIVLAIIFHNLFKK